jgi:hydrogenase large subunit
MSHVVVDPVTRIEGHLRIEAEVDGGQVQDAWSSSTMFRGIELILKGRDPRDAWAFTQRICGVCTTVHAIASVRSVENAVGAKPPPNARVLRNLIMASQCIQDHVIHFYHLHALDWVDVVSALKADPEKTSALAQSISDWPLSSTKYFAGVKSRLKDFVDRGQLGPFANAYWGHPAYKLPPEANLLAVAHYLEALDWQRDFIKIHAILGGKNPHLQSFLVGGMATPVDPDKQASINMGSVAKIKELTLKAREFVTKVYLPDVLAVASFYKDWAGVGGGVGNYMVYGEYPETDDDKPPLFLPSGIIRNKNLGKVEPLDPSKITESVKHSWYEDGKALHPREGETRPKYTGPKPPYERLETAAKYSWLKSPRYDGEPMEVGPLSRMLVAYGSGHKRVQELVGTVLKSLGVGPEALFSTLGRIAARCVETVLLTEKIDSWVDALAGNMEKGDLRIHDTGKWRLTAPASTRRPAVRSATGSTSRMA